MRTKKNTTNYQPRNVTMALIGRANIGMRLFKTSPF